MHVKADLSPFPSWLKRTALPSQLVMTGGKWSVLKWRGDVHFPTWCFVCCFKRLIQQQRNCSANILALVFWAAAGKLPEAGLGQKCSPRRIWPRVPIDTGILCTSGQQDKKASPAPTSDQCDSFKQVLCPFFLLYWFVACDVGPLGYPRSWVRPFPGLPWLLPFAGMCPLG